ncbi:MAG: bifunctional UDP-N-acetylglucosamine diphosphorylase/glucosamine-1-phosphate N-acetyltransferase GlmU [Chthonomonadales bacterium]
MPDVHSQESPLGRPLRAAVILAAGKSTRMRSAIPKALHSMCGRPLTRHVVEACKAAGISRIIVVVGHQAEAVKAGLGDDVEYALQERPLGTGDAARAAEPLLRDWQGTVLVLAGDVPLLRPQTIERMMVFHEARGAAATLLTAFLDDPTGYGRIVRGPDGSVMRIVEHKDATEQERAIKEWNPSIYAFRGPMLFEAVRKLRPENAQGELYLTDAIELLTSSGHRVEAVAAEDVREVLGVNTRVELAEAAAILRRRILEDLMLGGVTITDPASTYVDVGVSVGMDTVLHPQTFLEGATSIGEGCTVGPCVRLMDTSVGHRCTIVSSQIVECSIGSGVRIGPFANLRPGCRIADGAKVGDFVELKNAVIGERVSAAHLSYIGDAHVGAGTNIGAGTITCNYDGAAKHRTVIGERVFVGSHATLIAPVTVGDGAYVAAASAVDEDVPEDALVIARCRQTVKPGWAKRKREERARGSRQ